MSAYAYLRKSVVRNETSDVSHEVQERAVRELAGRHGDDGDSLNVLVDWDASGRLGADRRPGYRALLDAIESGRCSAVYSYSLSRLSRSVGELDRLIKDCVARKIPVRLYADHVDTTTASGRLLTHVLSDVAEFEADAASERTKAAIAARAARGELIGSRPYGDLQGEDAPAVMAAFAEAGSYSGAARLLNERGVKPRSSAKWWPSSVNGVVRYRGPMPRRGSKGVRAGGSSFTLSRLLRCPTCGTLLTGSRDPHWGDTTIRYSCRMGSSLPHARTSISEHLILPAIRVEAERLRTPDAVAVASVDEAERAKLERRRAQILDMYEDEAITKAERDDRLRAIYEAMERLDVHRAIQAVPQIDWTWPAKELNSVLRAIFASITLDAQTFQPVAFEWTVPEWRAGPSFVSRS
jgi:DNA invertase Pin-like site-specific DNA recombinase